MKEKGGGLDLNTKKGKKESVIILIGFRAEEFPPVGKKEAVFFLDDGGERGKKTLGKSRSEKKEKKNLLR